MAKKQIDNIFSGVKTEEKDKAINVRIESSKWERFQALCKKKGIKPSDAVRKLIDWAIEEN